MWSNRLYNTIGKQSNSFFKWLDDCLHLFHIQEEFDINFVRRIISLFLQRTQRLHSFKHATTLGSSSQIVVERFKKMKKQEIFGIWAFHEFHPHVIILKHSYTWTWLEPALQIFRASHMLVSDSSCRNLHLLHLEDFPWPNYESHKLIPQIQFNKASPLISTLSSDRHHPVIDSEVFLHAFCTDPDLVLVDPFWFY